MTRSARFEVTALGVQAEMFEAIRKKLHFLKSKRKNTLAEISSRSGISHATASMLTSNRKISPDTLGRLNPTLRTVARLALALDTKIDIDFVDENTGKGICQDVAFEAHPDQPDIPVI